MKQTNSKGMNSAHSLSLVLTAIDVTSPHLDVAHCSYCLICAMLTLPYPVCVVSKTGNYLVLLKTKKHTFRNLEFPFPDSLSEPHIFSRDRIHGATENLQ